MNPRWLIPVFMLGMDTGALVVLLIVGVVTGHI